MSELQNIMALRQRLGSRPARVAFVGDSRTAGSAEVTYGTPNFASNSSLIASVTALMRGKIIPTANFDAVTYTGFTWTGRDTFEGHSKSGAGMESFAGITKQVINSRPDIAVNAWGYNSIGLYDADPDKYTAMARSILSRQMSQGILPVVVNVPRGVNRDQAATIRFNLMTRELCKAMGFPYVDIAGKFDPLYPDFLVAGELIHYTQNGKNMATILIAETLNGMLGTTLREFNPFVKGLSDTENSILANYADDTYASTAVGAGFVGVKGAKMASNQPANFTERGGIAGIGVCSASPDPGYGNAFTMVKESGDKCQIGYGLISTGFTAGDELLFFGEVQTSGMSEGNSNWSATVAQTGGPGTITGVRKLEFDTEKLMPGEWAPFFVPFKVGAGTTSLQPAIRIEISNPNLANCSGRISVRRHGVLNMTTGGYIRNV